MPVVTPGARRPPQEHCRQRPGWALFAVPCRSSRLVLNAPAAVGVVDDFEGHGDSCRHMARLSERTASDTSRTFQLTAAPGSATPPFGFVICWLVPVGRPPQLPAYPPVLIAAVCAAMDEVCTRKSSIARKTSDRAHEALEAAFATGITLRAEAKSPRPEPG